MKTVCSIKTSLEVNDILEFSRINTSYVDYHKNNFYWSLFSLKKKMCKNEEAYNRDNFWRI